MGRVVDGCDGPGHPDAQENVHGVAAGDVPDGRVRVLVLRGCHLAGKGVCGGNKGRNTLRKHSGKDGNPQGKMETQGKGAAWGCLGKENYG